MICHSVLRKVISPNALVPLTRSDLRFALRGILGVFIRYFALQQSRAEHGQRPRLILLLRALVGTPNYQAARLVNDLHRAIGRIHPLATWPRGAANAYVQILGPNFDIYFLGFR